MEVAKPQEAMLREAKRTLQARRKEQQTTGQQAGVATRQSTVVQRKTSQQVGAEQQKTSQQVGAKQQKTSQQVGAAQQKRLHSRIRCRQMTQRWSSSGQEEAAAGHLRMMQEE
jgi:hypothetical protein